MNSKNLVIILMLAMSSVANAKPNAHSQHGSAHSKMESGTYSESVEGLKEIVPTQIVELKDGDTYKLTAQMVKQKIGKTFVKRFAYNGMIPGPTFKIAQDATIKIDFKNETDAPTTIHSHGVRLDYRFDGVAGVGGQKEIGTGESFTYELKFPDAGIYWYHPHVREDYGQDHGLYGNFLVVPSAKDYYSEVNNEELLVVDDTLVGKGSVPFQKDRANFALMGRFGNTMLLNGRDDYKLKVKKGTVTRFYITNAANTRTFNVAFKNAKMKLVAGDGGKFEKESFVDSVVIAPSERYVVEVQFDKPGEVGIMNVTPKKTTRLGVIQVTKETEANSFEKQFSTLRENSEVIKDIDAFRKDFDKKPDKTLNISIGMGGMKPEDHMAMMKHSMHGGAPEKIEWEDTMGDMNAKSSSNEITWKLVDSETGKANMDINWTFKKGDRVKVRIVNDPNSMHPMQHPIHFHGQRFLVLSTNGVQNKNLAWKDSALVQTGDTVDILIDVSNPGQWMGHCHIAEHQMAGMMIDFKVE